MQPSISTARVMYVPDVTERTGICAETLRWMRYAGKGPKSFKVGRRIAYLDHDVEEWLATAYETTRRGA